MRALAVAVGALFVLAGLAAGGWFTYQAGLDQGRSECQAASLESQLKAQKYVNDNLRSQITRQAAAVATSESAKSAADAALTAAKARASTILVGKDCSLGPDAIGLLNSVRGVQ